MTPNEIILLMDIHRGGDNKHPDYQHTVEQLAREGYIQPEVEDSFEIDYILTFKGQAMVDALLSVGLKLVWETELR